MKVRQASKTVAIPFRTWQKLQRHCQKQAMTVGGAASMAILEWLGQRSKAKRRKGGR